MTPGESLFGIGFADESVPVSTVSAYRQAAGNNRMPSRFDLSDDEFDLMLESRARLRFERNDDPYSIYD